MAFSFAVIALPQAGPVASVLHSAVERIFTSAPAVSPIEITTAPFLPVESVCWMHASDKEIETVLETLIMEAVGDGFEAMVAVGEVIRNRARLEGLSYKEVCLEPYQFSCWNDRQHAAEFMKNHRTYLRQALEAWHISGGSNLTRGATHYHADYVSPEWAPYYRRLTQIGSHIFYGQNS